MGEVAKETDRSKSYLIQKAIEAYLDDLADLQVSMDRLHDTTDAVVSLEDMRADLGL
ncbi:MAG: DNA-binding protein [Candidatus Sabulitectum sp.]|nr:DNA-binding protein [Candidatus Sabulitectum sp.]